MKFFRNVGVVAIALTILAACAPEAKEDPAVSEMRAVAATQSAMLAAVKTLIEVWDSKELDKLDAIAIADYKRTAPDQNAGSLDELKAFITQVHTMYPDFSISHDAAAAGPDGVFVQWTVTATNTGEGAIMPPSGNAVELTGISRYQFVDGKIAAELVTFDAAALMAQLQAGTEAAADE